MAEDKRIRDLQLGTGLLLSDFLPIDRAGWPEAKRFTPQDLVDIISGNTVKQQLTTGTGNPDNAQGVNGDFYFKIAADGSNIVFYEKVGNSWADKGIFTAAPPPTSLIERLQFTEADLVSDGAGSFYLPLGLTGTRVTLAAKSSAGWSVSGGDVEQINGILNNEAQNIFVYVGGVDL